MVGLILFGVAFAINSAVHSYLILAYSDFEKVSMNVGFYYMANAGGRLAGTVLSGLVYQTQGLEGCLWWSTGFVLAALVLSLRLPEVPAVSARAVTAGCLRPWGTWSPMACSGCNRARAPAMRSSSSSWTWRRSSSCWWRSSM